MFLDPLYLVFFVPTLLFSLYSGWKVKSTFKRFSAVRTSGGITGAEAARRIIAAKGMSGVRVERSQGFLSDHYDPSAKVLRLSPDVYDGATIAALGVAAHEAGHAIQHAKDYGPLRFRSLIVKPAQIGSNLGTLLLMVGIFLNSANLALIGVVLFGAFVVFTLITLPVEFDASNRAVATLGELQLLRGTELDGARKVLNAAAMTYVASAAAAISQLLYFLIRSGLLGGSRED